MMMIMIYRRMRWRRNLSDLVASELTANTGEGSYIVKVYFFPDPGDYSRNIPEIRRVTILKRLALAESRY